MTPIRLIQVGLGGWGRSWAKLVAQHGDLAHAVAYVDVQPAVLQQLQMDLGVSAEMCFPSLDAALAATDADAVLVTTTLAGHVPVVVAALEANKHVLVEKPFAPSLLEAQQAVNLAAAQRRVLMVSQNYRFYPAAQTAAKLIRDGALGPVSAVSVQFRKYANTAPPGAHWHYALRHPLLMDMAIHHFDLMRFVLDQEPQTITCHAWNPPWSNFTDPAAAVATITFDGGAVVNYQGSWVSTAPPTTWAGAWQIECAEGTITWTGRDDTSTNADAVTIRRRGKRARRVPTPALPHWDRAGSLEAFVAAVRDGTAPLSSGQNNIQSLALMFAAIKSATTGQPQAVDAMLPGGAWQK
jgi:predicted dehydrogenase